MNTTSGIEPIAGNRRIEIDAAAEPFYTCALWRYQRRRLEEAGPREEAEQLAEIATPALALAYAECIVGAWQDALEAGTLNLDQPLVVLELLAANGRFASFVLSALRRLTSDTPFADADWLYLISDPRPARLSACWNHPRLWCWFEAGKLDTVPFDPACDRHLDIASRQLVFGPRSLANPLTVIANGVFSALPQALYHAHFGTCHDAFARIAVSDERQFNPDGADSVLSVHYEWREQAGEPRFRELLAHYVEELDSTPIVFPETALDCLERLSVLSRRGLCVLLADRGFHTMQRLREQSEPEFGTPGRFFLPVNGHVLARYAASSGGAARQAQLDDSSLLYSVLSIGPYGGPGRRGHAAFERNFAERTPDALRALRFQLRERAPALLPVQLLSHLRLSTWDSRVLADCLPALLQMPLNLTAAERLHWIDALSRVWDGYFPVGEDVEFAVNVARFAMRLSAWGLAVRCFSSLSACALHTAAIQYDLALCHYSVENIDEALRAAHRASALDPDNPHFQQLEQQLHEWSAYCNAAHCYDSALCRDGDLSIHPFGLHQTAAAMFQLRDANITVQTGLPAWKDQDEFSAWVMKRQVADNEACFAVVHAIYGFVGIVSLQWKDDKGYFYFWIGADYQNRCFGSRAARLMFNMAEEKLGIAQVYTCAFRDNTRSRRALGKLGFAMLPFDAKEPDQDAVFYRRAAATTPGDAVLKELTGLLRDLGLPFALVDSEQVQTEGRIQSEVN